VALNPFLKAAILSNIIKRAAAYALKDPVAPVLGLSTYT